MRLGQLAFLSLGVLGSACGHSVNPVPPRIDATQPTPVPDPDFAEAMRWQRESAVNAGVAALFGPGFTWGYWKRSGRIAVTENGVASTWQALGLEWRREGFSVATPCNALGGVSIYAWRPLPDSSGIEAITLHARYPATPEQLEFTTARPPYRSDCTGNQPARLFRSQVRAPRTPQSPLAAFEGRATIASAVLSRAPCRFASGRKSPTSCEESKLTFSVDASIGTTTNRSTLSIGLTSIPTFLTPNVPCDGQCNTTVTTLPARGWTDNLGSRFSSWGASRPVVRWRDTTVDREMLAVVFAPEVSDQAVVAAIDAWSARIVRRGPAGLLFVDIPHPGTENDAMERAIDRMMRRQGVESVTPFVHDRKDGGLRLLGADGRLETTLRDSTGAVINGYVCLGLPPTTNGLPGRGCRRPSSAGAIVFDSVPAFDFTVHAVCTDTVRDRVWATDSTVVRIYPGKTATPTLRPKPCSSVPR